MGQPSRQLAPSPSRLEAWTRMGPRSPSRLEAGLGKLFQMDKDWGPQLKRPPPGPRASTKVATNTFPVAKICSMFPSGAGAPPQIEISMTGPFGPEHTPAQAPAQARIVAWTGVGGQSSTNRCQGPSAPNANLEFCLDKDGGRRPT